MKKSLLYVLCLMLPAGACMQDQTNPLVIGTCYDGKKNRDEKDIDCGGPCLACKEPVVSPCASDLKNNVINALGKNWTLADYQAYVYMNYTFFIALSSSQDLNIILGEYNVPTEDKIYPIVNHNSVSEGNAGIVLYDASGGWDYITHYASSGSVYVTVRDGKVTAELCSVPMKNDWNSNTSYLSGRITSK